MASVLVSNLGASSADEATLREFFSYSGVVSGVTLHDGANGARSATVSFASKDALATALLLTGATMTPGEAPITVVEVVSSPSAGAHEAGFLGGIEEKISSMLAKGYTLGKGALEKAKALDEQHGVSASMKKTADDVNSRLRLSERTKAVAASIGDADKHFGVSEKLSAAAAGARSGFASASASVVGAVEKAAPPAAAAARSAVEGAKGLLAKAQSHAGDVVAAAKAKVAAASGGDGGAAKDSGKA